MNYEQRIQAAGFPLGSGEFGKAAAIRRKIGGGEDLSSDELAAWHGGLSEKWSKFAILEERAQAERTATQKARFKGTAPTPVNVNPVGAALAELRAGRPARPTVIREPAYKTVAGMTIQNPAALQQHRPSAQGGGGGLDRIRDAVGSDPLFSPNAQRR